METNHTKRAIQHCEDLLEVLRSVDAKEDRGEEASSDDTIMFVLHTMCLQKELDKLSIIKVMRKEIKEHMKKKEEEPSKPDNIVGTMTKAGLC